MVTITNQMLYNALKAEFSKNGVTDVTAEEAYSYFTEALTGQEGFSEELVEKCASVAFDAANDCYSKQCGTPSQNTYSDDNLECLFTAESEQEFYSWISAVGKSLKAGWNKSVADGKQIRKVRQRIRKNKGLLASLMVGRPGFISGYRAGKAARKAYNKAREEDKLRKTESKATKNREDKNFFRRFNDDKGAFMGMGKKGTGLKTWAKQNKAQAATAAAVGTAAVAGGAYLTYKAIKKRKAAKQAQQNQNQTQNQAANA